MSHLKRQGAILSPSECDLDTELLRLSLILFAVALIISSLFFFFLVVPCGLWDPSSPTRDQPGIEPGPLAVKARSPNHWIAREFPKFNLLWNLAALRFSTLSALLLQGSGTSFRHNIVNQLYFNYFTLNS